MESARVCVSNPLHTVLLVLLKIRPFVVNNIILLVLLKITLDYASFTLVPCYNY